MSKRHEICEDGSSGSSHLQKGLTLGRLGIELPQNGSQSPNVAGLATEAERLGFETLWVSELTTTAFADPLAVLSHVAAVTRTCRLGIAVLVAPLHTPFRLANQLATIDVLSVGRLIIGVGFGSKPEIYGRYGLSTSQRLKRYIDGIELMRGVWTNDRSAFENGMWSIDQKAMVVQPVQQPHPPIFMGARKAEAIRRVAKIGDGWVASGSAPFSEFVSGIETLHRALDQEGRDPEGFQVLKRVYAAVSENEPRDRERMRQWFSESYGFSELPDCVAVGSTDRLASHIGDLFDLGVDHVILNPVFDEPGQFEALAGIVPASAAR